MDKLESLNSLTPWSEIGTLGGADYMFSLLGESRGEGEGGGERGRGEGERVSVDLPEETREDEELYC
jgi:hypothetical protein